MENEREFHPGFKRMTGAAVSPLFSGTFFPRTSLKTWEDEPSTHKKTKKATKRVDDPISPFSVLSTPSLPTSPSTPKEEVTWSNVKKKKCIGRYVDAYVSRIANERTIEQKRRLRTLCNLVFASKTISQSEVVLSEDGIVEIKIIEFDKNEGNYVLTGITKKTKAKPQEVKVCLSRTDDTSLISCWVKFLGAFEGKCFSEDGED